MSDGTPLYILLSAMREKWAAEDMDGVVAIARAAAPYLHPKVPAARPISDLSGVSDVELDRIERDIRAWEARQHTRES